MSTYCVLGSVLDTLYMSSDFILKIILQGLVLAFHFVFEQPEDKKD